MAKNNVTTSNSDAIFDETELRKRKTYLVRMSILLSLIQLATLVVLVVIYPTMDPVLWRVLVIVFVIILVMSIAAIFVSGREAQQISTKLRDPLTNLFDRSYLEETLEREIYRAQRSKSTIGIIMVAIDNTQSLISTYGQNAWNDILKKMAKSILESVRAYDVACRYSAEKVVFVLTEASQEITTNRAAHICKLVADFKISDEGKSITGITSSAGVTMFPNHGQTVEVLLRNTETALQAAHSKGGNQVEIYQP